MTKRIAIASLLLCLLAACGNKGPLVMPAPAPADIPVPADPQPEPTPADVPASAPETDDGNPRRH